MSLLKADWRGIREAVDTIRNGYIVAYPTETFYGLGVDPFNESAIERLINLKKRENGKPIPLLISDREMLERLVEDIPPLAERLMERFWPGPLTLVFRAREDVSKLLTGRTGKIGLRISSNPVAKRLVEFLNSPVTTTSANPSGARPALTPDEVRDYFDEKVALILDYGRLTGEKGSTVIDVTGDGIEIIREGEIPVEEINF